MLMDKMTEMVAHMVGIFQTTLEAERMRDVYDKFKAMKAADPDNDALEAMGITFKAKYTLEGFTPGVRYSDSATTDATSDISSPFYSGASYPIYKLPPIVSAPESAANYYVEVSGGGRALLTLEPPASVVVITYQQAFLTDDDVLILGDGETDFTDPAELLAQLQTYQTVAKAIAAPLSAEMITPGENATADAIALHDKVAAAEVSTISGVSAEMLRAEDAFGLHINGVEVDEMPSIDDLLPAFKSDDDEAEDDEPAAVEGEGGDDEATEDAAADEDYEFPDPFEGMSQGFDDNGVYDVDIDAGHAIVAGANALINEIVINMSWLDAPVFSVMGDVIKLDVISQVNVLIEHDYGTFGEFVASTAMNAASLSATATTPVPEEGEEPQDTEDLGLPANWAVTRIDGDLITVNEVNQYSFVTDHDRAEIVLSSTNTYIGLGDNTVVNLTDLAELGFGYDLIMIGGSMISVNWINQTNVLIDSDTVIVGGVDGAVGVSVSDNLVLNSASINSIGVDAYAEMQDNFAQASEAFADGAQTIDESVAHDSIFEGVEILRVLYVEGDLTTINWIEQTNVLGDSDQVHLAMEGLEASTGAAATVTTGSNTVINTASINQYGVDSTVAVNGDVYDDALLYQAELIDTDADPLGVDMPALANEAVAFLADDMMGPEISAEDTTIIATSSESTASSDVMQTMLA